MNTREGKSVVNEMYVAFMVGKNEPCPIFRCDWRSIATMIASSREVRCDNHSLTSSYADLRLEKFRCMKTF